MQETTAQLYAHASLPSPAAQRPETSTGSLSFILGGLYPGYARLCHVLSRKHNCFTAAKWYLTYRIVQQVGSNHGLILDDRQQQTYLHHEGQSSYVGINSLMQWAHANTSAWNNNIKFLKWMQTEYLRLRVDAVAVARLQPGTTDCKLWAVTQEVARVMEAAAANNIRDDEYRFPADCSLSIEAVKRLMKESVPGS